ncbi:unnamed protein product [Adineta steineri]|uniref:Uncharacterized protein n=1 Tax=Adineta steineri TaxID=433720 RepID=A0A815XH73_9BILA|nr:unnamed protein product [Adineta steineri]CAF1557511.1 unnamed protein product [Adineta steineri]
MGAICSCTSGKKPSTKDVKQKIPVVEESKKTQVFNSSQEILDDNFKTSITKAIDEHIVTVPTAYQTERDRIVNEMKQSDPSSYLGLLYSEYPDINGQTVNDMARKLVTSNKTKQELIDRIDRDIESSFVSRTIDWNSSSRETVRPLIRVFIEKSVNDAFDHIKLE